MGLSNQSVDYLNSLTSWTLNRVSPNTRFDTLMQKNEHRFHPTHLDGIRFAQRNGTLYRFRVADGPWYFGASPDEAIQRAKNHQFVFRRDLVETHVK